MKRLKKKSSNIELLLTACAFAAIVVISIGIALYTWGSEDSHITNQENHDGENTEHVEENKQETKKPIEAIQAPTNETVTPVVAGPEPIRTVYNIVPFTAQAPTRQWSDDRQQNACEEASALMAVWWLKGEKPASLQDARDQILAIAAYQEKVYGSSKDTDASDTVTRIFEGYFQSENAKAVEDISLQDIIQEIMKGNLVIVPMNGIKLANPKYTQPGPPQHMILIIGYDASKKEFVTNDPGINSGNEYRYGENRLYEAIREYPTGNHLPITGNKRTMIVVSK